MEKKCCNIEVEELKDGFLIEIKGEGIKEKCRDAVKNCCSEENLCRCFESLCSSGQGKSCCC